MNSMHNTIRKAMHRLRQGRGFTMIEALVTIVIFAFIAGGVYATIAYAVRWGHDPTCLLPVVTVVSLN